MVNRASLLQKIEPLIDPPTQGRLTSKIWDFFEPRHGNLLSRSSRFDGAGSDGTRRLGSKVLMSRPLASPSLSSRRRADMSSYSAYIAKTADFRARATSICRWICRSTKSEPYLSAGDCGSVEVLVYPESNRDARRAACARFKRPGVFF